MKSTSQHFELISLHDAKIDSITRTDDSIAFSLSFAGLLKGHPCNPLGSDHLICLNPQLTLHHVQREECRTWNDDRKLWETHQHPEQPLDDEILEAKQESDHFFINGFHEDGWSEWRIWSDAFTLTWVEDHPYHMEKPGGQPSPPPYSSPAAGSESGEA